MRRQTYAEKTVLGNLIQVVDRVKKAIPDLADPRERLYMGLLAYIGMRVEEIVGLRWENVFLDKHYGEVRRVVIYPDRKKTCCT